MAIPRLATSSCCRSSRQTRGGRGGDNNQAPRAFAREITCKVSAEFCEHNSALEPLAEVGAELKKQDTARHPGLCGHHHAWMNAAVKTQDVDAKCDYSTGNKFRNQVRFHFYLRYMRAT